MHLYSESPSPKAVISPVRLHATISYSDSVPLTLHVRDQLIYDLLPSIADHIAIDCEYDPYHISTTFHAELVVLPLDTKHLVQSDHYTYNQQHFTRAEIDAAIQYTYPERFL